MSFDAIIASVQNWLQQTTLPKFELYSISEPEKKFHFTWSEGSKTLAFYILFDEGDNNINKWHVWSDDESALEILNPVITYLNECETAKSLEDVLQHVRSSLTQTCSILKSESEHDEDIDVDDDVDYDYFNEEEENEGKAYQQEGKYEKNDKNFYQACGTTVAVQRLVKDLKAMKNLPDCGFEAKPDGDNLFKWRVKLKDFPPESKLAKDLKAYGEKNNTESVVNMELQFPDDYPFSPPFLRVVVPRFRYLTGHITIGGSICMQMLTNSGWVPTNDIESILVTVRAEIISDENAELDQKTAHIPYTDAEARDAFDRMVKKYKW